MRGAAQHEPEGVEHRRSYAHAARANHRMPRHRTTCQQTSFFCFRASHICSHNAPTHHPPEQPKQPDKTRVIDLAQGCQWDGPVHVHAAEIFGHGKFYVAVTRCRDLRQLKISGLEEGNEALRKVVKSCWRAINFHVHHGQEMPGLEQALCGERRGAGEGQVPQPDGSVRTRMATVLHLMANDLYYVGRQRTFAVRL